MKFIDNCFQQRSVYTRVRGFVRVMSVSAIFWKIHVHEIECRSSAIPGFQFLKIFRILLLLYLDKVHLLRLSILDSVRWQLQLSGWKKELSIFILIRYMYNKSFLLLGVILSHMMNNLIKDHKPEHLGSVNDVATNETQIIKNQTDEWDTSNRLKLKHKQFGTTGNLKRSLRKVSWCIILAINMNILIFLGNISSIQALQIKKVKNWNWIWSYNWFQ